MKQAVQATAERRLESELALLAKAIGHPARVRILSLLLARGLGWYAAAAAVAAALLEVALLVGRHADVGEIVSDVLVATSIYALALTIIAAATVGWRRSVDTEPQGA